MKISNRIILILCMILMLRASFAIARNNSLSWQFPLPRTHTGMLIGNGTQGLMIWGEGNRLYITIGHQGFWDHRSGNNFLNQINFQELRNILYAKDEEKLKKAFEVPLPASGLAFDRPKQFGGGRLEVRFPEGSELRKGTLSLAKGEARITLLDPGGKQQEVVVRQSVFTNMAWVDLPTGIQTSLKLVPSWEHIQEIASKGGVRPPEVWQNGQARGFVQPLPEDKPLGIGYLKKAGSITIASYIGDTPEEKLTSEILHADRKELLDRSDAWWNEYWASVPGISLPDPVLQEIVDYGLYKQACSTPPHAGAAGLQGPFMEEYQMIPWSNDYHFNINVQMIYTPAFASNRPQHLGPLWEMVHQWMPQLPKNGENFFGRKGALILPHAVDDRGQVIGSFWTGSIDHGCTAWVAYMAWQHYRYTMDKSVLEKTAWPLLTGAFEGFWAMLEETSDAGGKKRFSLPVSVSPEYGGSRPNAWE